MCWPTTQLHCFTNQSTTMHVSLPHIGPETSPEVEADLKTLLDKPESIPLPTYFIGAWGTSAEAVLRVLRERGKDGSTAPNLHYLGRYAWGLLACVLFVCFLCGTRHVIVYLVHLCVVEQGGACIAVPVQCTTCCLQCFTVSMQCATGRVCSKYRVLPLPTWMVCTTPACTTHLSTLPSPPTLTTTPRYLHAGRRLSHTMWW